MMNVVDKFSESLISATSDFSLSRSGEEEFKTKYFKDLSSEIYLFSFDDERPKHTHC